MENFEVDHNRYVAKTGTLQNKTARMEGDENSISNQRLIVPLVQITKYIQTKNQIVIKQPKLTDFNRAANDYVELERLYRQSGSALFEIYKFVRNEIPGIDQLIDPNIWGKGKNNISADLLQESTVKKMLSKMQPAKKTLVGHITEYASDPKKLKYIVEQLIDEKNTNGYQEPVLEASSKFQSLSADKKALVVYYLFAIYMTLEIYNEKQYLWSELSNHPQGIKAHYVNSNQLGLKNKGLELKESVKEWQAELSRAGDELYKEDLLKDFNKSWPGLRNKYSNQAPLHIKSGHLRETLYSLYDWRKKYILDVTIAVRNYHKNLANEVDPKASKVFPLYDLVDAADGLWFHGPGHKVEYAHLSDEKIKGQVVDALAQPDYFDQVIALYDAAIAIHVDNPDLLRIEGKTHEDLLEKKALVVQLKEKHISAAAKQSQLDVLAQKIEKINAEDSKKLKAVPVKIAALEKQYRREVFVQPDKANRLARSGDILKEIEKVLGTYEEVNAKLKKGPEDSLNKAKAYLTEAQTAFEENDPVKAQSRIKASREKADEAGKMWMQLNEGEMPGLEEHFQAVRKLENEIAALAFKTDFEKNIKAAIGYYENFDRQSDKTAAYKKIAEAYVVLGIILSKNESFNEKLHSFSGYAEFGEEYLKRFVSDPLAAGEGRNIYVETHAAIKNGSYSLFGKRITYEALTQILPSGVRIEDSAQLGSLYKSYINMTKFLVNNVHFVSKKQSLGRDRSTQEDLIFYLAKNYVPYLENTNQPFSTAELKSRLGSDRYARLETMAKNQETGSTLFRSSRTDNASQYQKAMALLLLADPACDQNISDFVTVYQKRVNMVNHIAKYSLSKEHPEYYKKNVVKILLELKELFLTEKAKRLDQIAIIDALLAMTGEKGVVEDLEEDHASKMKH